MKLKKSILLFFCLAVGLNLMAQTPATAPPDLEQQLISAQIAYYQMQTREKSLWESLAGALPSLIGTFVGAGLALFGVRWSTNRQWKLEQEKWKVSQKNEALKEVRSAAAELSKKIAAEIQAIIWLTWIGQYKPQDLAEKDLDDYNQEMKKFLMEDVVAQTHLAFLDISLYKKMKTMAKDVLDLDHQIAFVIHQFKQSNTDKERLQAAIELGKFYEKATKFYNSIPDKLGHILPATDE